MFCLKDGEDLFLLHVRMFRDQRAELADLFEPVGRARAHVLELVDEGLDVAVLAFELVGVNGHVRFAKRRIDDHLFLVRMLVERMGQLHQKHAALPGLRLIGREHLVEDAERQLMLGRQDVVPVAGGSFQALHHELAAVIGGEADGGAGKGRAEQRAGIVAPGEGAALAALLAAALALVAAVLGAASR